MYQGSGTYQKDDNADRRAFINNCMAQKFAAAGQPYSSSTALLATGKDDPTKAFTAAVPTGSGATQATGGGFNFSSIPTSYLMIGAAVAAYLLFKKR